MVIHHEPYYEYDQECQVLIKIPDEGIPVIMYRRELRWRDFEAQDELYERAIYLGQGCWERLQSISEEEALEILDEWGYLKKLSDERFQIMRDTRVLFYIKDRDEYLLTNEPGEINGRLRVFAARKNGSITMKGYLLGSIAAHDPYILEELEPVNCRFEELNPEYFDQGGLS